MVIKFANTKQNKHFPQLVRPSYETNLAFKEGKLTLDEF
jgi:hypothetical protein